jgi:hypothetical protein
MTKHILWITQKCKTYQKTFLRDVIYKRAVWHFLQINPNLKCIEKLKLIKILWLRNNFAFCAFSTSRGFKKHLNKAENYKTFGFLTFRNTSTNYISKKRKLFSSKSRLKNEKNIFSHSIIYFKLSMKEIFSLTQRMPRIERRNFSIINLLRKKDFN